MAIITSIQQLPEPYNWDDISRFSQLSEGFIREFQTDLNHYMLFKYQDLSETFIREYLNNNYSWEYELTLWDASHKYIQWYLNLINSTDPDAETLLNQFIYHINDPIDIETGLIRILPTDYLNHLNEGKIDHNIIIKNLEYPIEQFPELYEYINYINNVHIDTYSLGTKYISYINNDVLMQQFINDIHLETIKSLIFKYQIISESFITDFESKFHWTSISKHQIISESFISLNSGKVDWNNISKYQKLSGQFIIDNILLVNWLWILKIQNVEIEYIKQYLIALYTVKLNETDNTQIINDFINYMSSNETDKEFDLMKIQFETYIDDTNFLRYIDPGKNITKFIENNEYISTVPPYLNLPYSYSLTNINETLTEIELDEFNYSRNIKLVKFNNFVIQSYNEIILTTISSNQVLSEEFIREFQNILNWSMISKHQILSEEFMREFELDLDWEMISNFKILSEEFMREFEHKLNFYVLRLRDAKSISLDFFNDFKNRLK